MYVFVMQYKKQCLEDNFRKFKNIESLYYSTVDTCSKHIIKHNSYNMYQYTIKYIMKYFHYGVYPQLI